jgi:hypothetical protein
MHCIPLLQGYEPKFWYFEVVVLVLKLLLSAVTVLFLPESVAQVPVTCRLDPVYCVCIQGTHTHGLESVHP